MSSTVSSDVYLPFLSAARKLSPFPPPLWGRVREGGTPRKVGVLGTPFPRPSPQGGGELTFAAAGVQQTHRSWEEVL
jgi:hypothetical protein